ncbi:hypothetical protein [Anoxybacillus sp. ST4]|uniref:hypothetical protein n=1 Tax=Anoxybacillus sp. ST4 TaxID=2864181 RepID=UPI001C640831|nr:hypothetical protein [Anoxybacillus sp. ST4]MBW7649805.1 hypothetical protein [Anoxybacillus sp. ST4]
MRDYKRLEQKQVTEMNGQEIEELMFHACRGASDQLFYGLAKRFLLQMEDEIRAIHERLEYLERLIKMLIESKNEAWKPNAKEAIANINKDALKQSLEEAMKVNTLRTFPMPKIEVPEFKKGADEK